jgi:hypothetical protein
MPAPPHRRWFQFSLGTILLLVTVLALWLAWELSFIRQRQAWVRENGSLVETSQLDPIPLPDGSVLIPAHPALVPWWRRLLGDAPVTIITERDQWTDADRRNVVRLFPEAALAKPPPAPSNPNLRGYEFRRHNPPE